MGVPATNIYLCADVPLNNRYDHTLYFETKQEQLAYFQSKVKKTLNYYAYVRKTWTLKVAATIDEARVWSYLYFQNGGVGKRYFYFINQVEYINDNTVELFLELDVIQTYMHDWVLHPCYVEREHSKTDEIGENTVDEGLDVGEYITAKMSTCNLCSDIQILMAATIDVNSLYILDEDNPTLASNYNGIFGGYQITATPLEDSWESLGVMLYNINTKGKADAVFNLWHYPGELITTGTGDFEDGLFARYITGTREHTFHVERNAGDIDGYVPKNNKLYQYPYRMLYVTANQGVSAVYHYEHFGAGELADGCTFKITGCIAPDASIRLTPVDYKGVAKNYDESLIMGCFPLCAWNNDSYKMWLAQNQNTQNLSYASSALKIAGGAAAIIGGAVSSSTGVGAAISATAIGSGVGMITSGASDIAQQLAQKADREIQPPQSRAFPGGSHNLANGIQNFDFYHKTIDAVHARMIDDFFNMYGYATRRVKKPEYTNRPWWNYIKTINSNITGNFAQEDIAKINAIFDKGITFWKTRSIGMYELDNSPN